MIVLQNNFNNTNQLLVPQSDDLIEQQLKNPKYASLKSREGVTAFSFYLEIFNSIIYAITCIDICVVAL